MLERRVATGESGMAPSFLEEKVVKAGEIFLNFLGSGRRCLRSESAVIVPSSTRVSRWEIIVPSVKPRFFAISLIESRPGRRRRVCSKVEIFFVFFFFFSV